MSINNVFLADYCGFCYGVKRAVDLALTTRRACPDRPVYTLGPIIHNPQMVAKLAGIGIEVAENINAIPPGGTVIIRSHGVGPETYKKAEKLNLEIADATCPHVKKAQIAAFELMKAGYQTIIIGEAHHPEVKSIFKWTDEKALIIETPADAQKICRYEKLGVVAQTTFSSETFQKIIAILKDKCDELEVNRTICTATDKRQKAALTLAGKVSVMVVVGGKNSANTARLVQTCSNAGCRTFYIETAQELDPAWFAKTENVGITAGASTPDWIIKEVYEKIMEITENSNTKEEPLTGNDEPAVTEDMAGHLEENELIRIEPDSIVSGKIVKVTRDEVFVDIGYKAEGVIALNELAFPVPEDANSVVAAGDVVKVYVLATESSDGNVKLSKIKADAVEAWDKLEQAMEEKTPLDGTVLAAVKGGLRVSVLGVSGFVPASLFDIRFVENLADYAGQKLPMVPIEIDRLKGKVVLSRKEVLIREREIKEREIFAKLAVGKVVQGRVCRIASFGAFVDLGGIDGLIHISDLSWQRVASVEEVVKVGDEVSAVVLKADPEAKKISLSLKETKTDPWIAKAEELTVDAMVKGEIVKIANFGVFVKMPNGLDGLVHVSEISDRHINKPQDAVSVGQEVIVKILRVDKDDKRISLSIAKAHAEKERNEYQSYKAESESQNSGNNMTLGEKFPDLFAKLK